MKKNNQVKSFILDYLKNKVPNYMSKGKMFTCYKCKELSANIFPQNSHSVHCYSPECGKLGDIYDICRELEFDGNKDVDLKDIENHLIKMFDIKTDSQINNLLEKYANWGWDLVPVSKNEKASNVEKEWQKKSHKDVREWQEWLKSGLNMGVKGGTMSDVLIIDFDLVPSKLKKKIYEGKATEKEIEEAKRIKAEKIEILKTWKFLDFTTVKQDTFGGIHLFYKNDEEIQKCAFDYEDIHIDIQSDGGQAVIEPSIVGGQQRTISGDEIKIVSSDLKEWIHSNRNPIKEENTKEIIENLEDGIIKGLEGCCNSTFAKVGGKFRKFLPKRDAEKVLHIINNDLLDDPMSPKDIKGLCSQINKYIQLDEDVLYKRVYEFLEKHEEANTRDLKECLGTEANALKEVLARLIKDNKVYKHRSLYKAINKVEWKTEFIQESKVLEYSVPYFNDYAVFRRGDMICIGAEPGIGKSHISLNIIRKLIENNVQPQGGIRYLSSEPGNRFAKIAMELGLKEGEFYFYNHYEPEKIELEDEAVTIIDWLLPEDFSQTANLYRTFAKQLDKHGGICFIFSQLNSQQGFYAEQMVKFFASFAVKYFYTEKNGVKDNQNTCFKTEKIRESKTNQQYITIPTYFDSNKRLEIKK